MGVLDPLLYKYATGLALLTRPVPPCGASTEPHGAAAIENRNTILCICSKVHCDMSSVGCVGELWLSSAKVCVHWTHFWTNMPQGLLY